MLFDLDFYLSSSTIDFEINYFNNFISFLLSSDRIYFFSRLSKAFLNVYIHWFLEFCRILDQF